MKYYSGYNKPYIYTAFNLSIEEKVNAILKPLNEKDVLFWHNNNINKKELNKIEMAFSIIVFVTNDFVKTDEFHKIINHAVKKNKEILTIYLEDVDLDAWGHMQLDSLQYLNVNQKNFESKLLEASIFKDMKVTEAQKRFQRRTTITAIATPIIAGIFVFFLIIEPLLIAPTRISSDTLGLNGLTQEELDSITELYIMGDQVYKDEDITKVHCWPNNNSKTIINGEISRDNNGGPLKEEMVGQVTRGTLSNLDDLSKLRNLKRLCICCQEVTDITPIFSLSNLEFLSLDCNPISSIEGINQLVNLEELWLSGTDIEDLSPLNGIKKLKSIGFDSTPVKVYPDTETLSHIDSLCVSATTKIPYLGKRDNIGNIDTRQFAPFYNNGIIRDFSFLKDVAKIKTISLGNSYISDFKTYFENIEFENFNAPGLLDLYSLSQLDWLKVTVSLDICHAGELISIDGIEKYDGLDEIGLKGCKALKDLRPLNNLKNVKLVILSSDMKDLALNQLNDDVCFEIQYQDD